MSEIYESKDYIVIDEDRYLIGEFDTRDEADKFVDEMLELGRQNLVILGPEWRTCKNPQEEMQKISDTIVDMIMDGADAEEIRKLIEFSKDVIDAARAERKKKGADGM